MEVQVQGRVSDWSRRKSELYPHYFSVERKIFKAKIVRWHASSPNARLNPTSGQRFCERAMYTTRCFCLFGNFPACVLPCEVSFVTQSTMSIYQGHNTSLVAEAEIFVHTFFWFTCNLRPTNFAANPKNIDPTFTKPKTRFLRISGARNLDAESNPTPSRCSLLCSFTFDSLTHSHTHSLTCSLTHSLAYSLTHSLARLLTHLLIHSLTHSCALTASCTVLFIL